MRRPFSLTSAALGLAALVLGACAPLGPSAPPSRIAVFEVALPPMKRFAEPTPVPPFKRNAEIARDFLDLSFQLESGRDLPRFTRFEGPVSVRVVGRPPATFQRDLDDLLGRLRREAGLEIVQVVSTAEARITIQLVRQDEIRRFLPQAACFVVPNVATLSEYRRARRSAAVNWANLDTRRQVAIFVPYDVAPQDLRDCLHEELAQALGPLNDLFRLTDSVFNDDNIHTVLTGFDMLILRATYDPALRSGMSRAEVAQRLPAILARLHPQGERPGMGFDPATPPAWKDAVQRALRPDTSERARAAAARDAVELARAAGWRDHRPGFAHYIEGRILQPSDPKRASAAFAASEAALRPARGTDLHLAYTRVQLAADALAARDPARVLALVPPAEAAARQYQNAALLASLMFLRAEALELSGRVSEAQALRMDSLGWARYGFGADWVLRVLERDLARLTLASAG